MRLAIVGALLPAVGCGGDKAAPDGPVTVAATRGPLQIAVRATGSLQASDTLILKSKLSGQAAVTYLVPDGYEAKAGQVLVELDTSDLESRLLEQRISVENAQADLVRAETNLALAQSRAKTDTDKAELDLEFARQDLRKYVQGDYPKEIKRLESDLSLNKQELANRRDQYEGSVELAQEGYIAQTELVADELAFRRAEQQVELSQADIALLQEYTRPRMLAELESDITQKAAELGRVKRQVQADVVQARADRNAKALTLDSRQRQFDRTEEQIQHAVITAPRDGIVIYATTAENSQGAWWRQEDPLREGAMVRERTELVHMPAEGARIAELTVYEHDLPKISVGQPATVVCSMAQDRVFTGAVSEVATLPDASRAFSDPNRKQYKVKVRIAEGDFDGIPSSASCDTTILIQQLADVVSVPIQCLATAPDGSGAYVYVQTPGGPLPRRVKAGLDNNRSVHIVAGVDAGEPVLLRPPYAPPAEAGGSAAGLRRGAGG